MHNGNIELLKKVCRHLRGVLREVVFVGGCTTGLFITDEGAGEVRPTFDVDLICAISSYAEYAAFAERLRALGFAEDTSEDAPVCRWLIDEMKVDVMPVEGKILGFTNRWYRAAMDAAQELELESGLRIRTVTAPYFVATKLEAFRGRGRGDFAGSHDMEDLVTVIDGRAEIVGEIRASGEVGIYIARAVRELLQNQNYLDALPGLLLPDAARQGRLPMLVERLKQIGATGQ